MRYYDHVGLLNPARHTEAGHRLYSDDDFLRLQQILALKFLGFSLDEISICLQTAPVQLQETLTQQKAMLLERRDQLDTVIQALDEAVNFLQTDPPERRRGEGDQEHSLNDCAVEKQLAEWQAIVNVIQVIQMQQNKNWQSKYLTEEQLKQMEGLSKQSYTPEQRAQLAEWGKNWTEEDQRQISQQWDELFAELKRLTEAGADPASFEAQELAAKWLGLIGQFTRGDAGITQGLKNWHQNASAMPAEQRPFQMPYNQASQDFIKKALEIYQQKKS